MQLPTQKSKNTLKLYEKAGLEFGAILKELSDIIQYTKKRIKTKDLMDLFEYKVINNLSAKFPNHVISFPCKTVVNTECKPFGNNMCISINDIVAHGKNKKTINKNDIVSIDTVIKISSAVSVINLDAAFTMQCGIGKDLDNDWFMRPLDALKSILENNCKTTNEIAKEIFDTARRSNEPLSIVSGLCGHGIGKEMHEQPLIYNVPILNDCDTNLINGMCFCPEPIYVKDNSLYSEIIMEEDGWSIKTISGKRATHFETTFGVINGNLIDFVGITNWPTEA
jgi:methionyl aminopeptidase